MEISQSSQQSSYVTSNPTTQIISQPQSQSQLSTTPINPPVQQCQPKQQQQDLITDFSSMFKSKGNPKFYKKQSKNKNNQTNNNKSNDKSPNWLLQIPAKLDITLDDVMRRRVMDQRRWMTITKCNTNNININNKINSNGNGNQNIIKQQIKQQIKQTKITNIQWSDKLLSAICSSWNYLYSDKGLGKQKYLSLNKFKQIITKTISLQQLNNINQYNRTQYITKIIQQLNNSQQLKFTKLKSQISIKLSHPNKSQKPIQKQKQQFLSSLKYPKSQIQQSSQQKQCSYIYLAYQDIFIPIGYDITYLIPLQAYSKQQNVKQQNTQLWIINSNLGRNQGSFIIKRWNDVKKDMETAWPQYFNIKQHKQGIRIRNDVTQQNKGQNRGSGNCIVKITKMQ